MCPNLKSKLIIALWVINYKALENVGEVNFSVKTDVRFLHVFPAINKFEI